MKTYIAYSPDTNEIIGSLTQGSVVKYAVSYFHPIFKKWLSPYFRARKDSAEREYIHCAEMMLTDKKIQKWTATQFKEAKKSLQIYNVTESDMPMDISAIINHEIEARTMTPIDNTSEVAVASTPAKKRTKAPVAKTTPAPVTPDPILEAIGTPEPVKKFTPPARPKRKAPRPGQK